MERTRLRQNNTFWNIFIRYSHSHTRGPGSVVGIANNYGLDGPGIEFRWEARFSAPVQTGPGAHPASCTMGTVFFPWVKSGRGVTLTLHPLLVPWSWRGNAMPLLPLWAVRPVQSQCLYKCALYLYLYDTFSVIKYCLKGRSKIEYSLWFIVDEI
jgi:hypothetical protein